MGLTLDLPIPVTHIDQFRESRVFTRPARRGSNGEVGGAFFEDAIHAWLVDYNYFL